MNKLHYPNQGSDVVWRDNRIFLIGTIVAAGFVCAVIFHYILGGYARLGFPCNTFLFRPDDAGRDFTHIQKAVNTGDPYSYAWSVYFPFTYVPLFFFSRLAIAASLGGFTIFVSMVVTGYIFSNLPIANRILKILMTAILAFMSYPVLFCLDRANLEGMVFACLVMFFFFLKKQRWSWAVIFLSCASAMKLYPGVFVLLLIARKQYVKALATVGLSAVLNLAAAACYPGGIVSSLASMNTKLAEYKIYYIIGDDGWAFSSSLFALMKAVLFALNLKTPELITQILPWYSLLVLGIFICLAFFIISVERDLWRQTAIISALIVLLPQVSGDYKLIHLFFPIMLFLNSEKNKNDLLYSSFFGFLLIPKAFFWITGCVNIGVVANPLLLVGLTLTLIIDRTTIRMSSMLNSAGGTDTHAS